jgi:hypothetical protein
MPDYMRLAKDESKFIALLTQISADALVITSPAKPRREPEQGPHALTGGLIGVGNWLFLAQCSFQINGSSDTEMEMRLKLAVMDGDKELYGRHAYLHLHGLNFGTSTIIGAFAVPDVASLELSYMQEIFGGDAFAAPSDAMIVAVKIPNIVAVA